MKKNFSDPAACESFGARLREARENCLLGRDRLAALMSVTEQTISAWEHGRTTPRANRMQTLAGVLNVSVGWLMAGFGDGPAARSSDPGADDIRALALTELNDIRREQHSLLTRLGDLENLLRDGEEAA